MFKPKHYYVKYRIGKRIHDFYVRANTIKGAIKCCCTMNLVDEILAVDIGTKKGWKASSWKRYVR